MGWSDRSDSSGRSGQGDLSDRSDLGDLSDPGDASDLVDLSDPSEPSEPSDPSDWEAYERALAAAHAALVSKGVLTRVGRGAAEQRAWADCDLASFAENRLGELCDPDGLDGATRGRWLAEAVGGVKSLPTPRKRDYESCYWIMRDGGRAGTLALGRYCAGDFASIRSIYLRPRHRGKRIMADTLRDVRDELEARGLGMKLESSWTWQPAVRFYLGTGFWLRSWKHELAFIRPPRTPLPVIAVGGAEATIAVEFEGRRTTLARARRDGDTLLEHGEEPELPDHARHLAHHALTTLALAIALEGWPLIRSQDHWERCRYSDFLHPEALADRFQNWEAWTASLGWRVGTPRIPGLKYPSWEELGGGWG